MTRGPLYVVGTRSFAAEVVEYATAAGFHVAGLLEPHDRDRVGTEVHGLPVAWLEDAGRVSAAVGTGERDRRQVAERLTAAGIEPVALVHPAAHVSASANIREGCVVGPAAVVGAETELGRHVVVGRGALVGHHVVVGDFATLNPGANVGGNTTIGSGALVAIGAVVRDHVRVGGSALVAAGAVVVGDVPDGVEVRGLPARPVERRDPARGSAEDGQRAEPEPRQRA
jgi:sugar O-acyltransferase (sialic acid O-acetyltransferase NeuD family)